MSKYIYLLISMSLLAACSEKNDKNIEIKELKQAHKTNDPLNVSTEDQFTLGEPYDIAAIFDMPGYPLVDQYLTTLYVNMYATQNHFLQHLSSLRDVDPDGEIAFGALKTRYLAFNPNNPEIAKTRYNLMLLSGFIMAQSSINFFETEALRIYDTCDELCSQSQKMTGAAAVRGLFRLYMGQPSSRVGVRDSLFRILAAESASRMVILEAIEILNFLGMSKTEIGELLHSNHSSLINVEALDTLPEPKNSYYDPEKIRNYGSDDPAPEVGGN